MAEEKTGAAAVETVEELAQQPPEKLAERVEEESRKEGGGRRDLLNHFSVVDVEFTKPLEWCGKTYERAHLDFSRLTGRDMEAIDDEMGGNLPAFPANSRRYQKLLAAKASKIPSDAITHLPAADYNAMVSAARNFLIATG